MADLVNQAEAFLQRSTTALLRKDFGEALLLCDEGLATNPNLAGLLYNRGLALQELGRCHDAVLSYDKALAVNPDNPAACYNRGNALMSLRRYEEALASYEHAAAIKPDHAKAYNNIGNVFREFRRYDEALLSYDKAIIINPDYVDPYCNRGVVLQELERYGEALLSYDAALALNPDYTEVHYNRGLALHDLKRYEEAVVSYERALALEPDRDFLFGMWLGANMKMCDWRGSDAHCQSLISKILGGEKVSHPFGVLARVDSLSIQHQAAKIYTQAKFPANPALPALAKHTRRDTIRIGYYSADFHDHPVSFLMAGLFEEHDRSRFELFAFSFGTDKHDGMRQRVVAAFDHFIDVRNQSDKDVAQLSRTLGIDVAVDLGGFTAGSRTGIFALRAAPIQVSYIGYLGTMGAGYMDYLIADTTLVPVASQHHYSEKIVYLPVYQVNDSKRIVSDRVFTRKELGLPETGMVFCCFNSPWKLTPEVFACWMRILLRVDGSVLFLYADNSSVVAHLQQSATLSGVAADRLIFGGHLPMPDYLARYRVADLFLDTAPYNGGATASDALWGGLPVLTCMGESFASRMAASLLNAIRLPELITTSLAEYEALAIELALNPEKLGEIRRNLERNRLTTPLFDTQRFTRHIEAAYTAMYERSMADLPPDHIRIEPIEAVNSMEFVSSGDAHIHESAFAKKYCHQGNVLAASGRYEEALLQYNRAISLQPDYAVACYNRGNTYKALNRYEEAAESYDRAIAARGDYVEAYNNRGIVLQELHRYEEAVACYEKVLAIKPDYVEAYANVGNALKALTRTREALECYNKAVMLNPDYAGGYWNLSLCYLLTGNFEKGWELYEWRWKTASFISPRRNFEQPLWLGNEVIGGKTILLHSEQGLGDAIQFCRYARMVAEKGAKVILEVHKPLIKLFANLDGVAQLVCYGDLLPAFDLHSPLLSLPLACKTTLGTIPCAEKYLSSNKVLEEAWHVRLGEKRDPRAGLVWSGSAMHRNNNNRSTGLQELLKQLPDGLEYISLQREVCDVDKLVLQSHPEIRHFGGELHDFSDTAALCELMDIVITVDTSVAHLSGALGKPTWVLLPFCPDWRWLLGRSDSPWYPTVRLFRQESIDNWDGVLQAVRKELVRFLEKSSQECRAARPERACVATAMTLPPGTEAFSALQLALALHQKGRLAEAEALYRQILQSEPNHFDSLRLLATVVGQRGAFAEALVLFDQALASNPDHSIVLYNRGLALQELRRYDEALASYDKAIVHKPDYAEAHNNRGIILREQGRHKESLLSYERATAVRPDYADAYNNRGNALQSLKRYEEAIACFEKAIALNPDSLFLLGEWLQTRMKICQWSDLERHRAQLVVKIERGAKVSAPFPLLALFDSLSIQHQAAKIYTQAKFPANPALPALAKHTRRDTIRIGYYSADFHDHPVSFLMAGLFEEHDRSRFELFAFSFGTDKHDGMRQRVVAAFDHFIDVRNQSDKDVAQLSRTLGIDVAVDLGGFTAGSRTGIFALRAAPIQVSYIGYLGTMGAGYMDYLIADTTLVPVASQHHYSEKIVYLPVYQVNDSKRIVSDRVFTRKELGLPETGMVFCCFNSPWKLTPEVFACWMRILLRVDGSVLFLYADNSSVVAHLQQSATLSGVAADRLIFGGHLPMPDYLARYRVADLFLDTAPYNGGATASDALWGGLPVLTCMGESFASRMAASLLNAIRLPELITTSLAEYEALAIELALNPEKLGEIRRNLERNRLTTPLFDTQRFTRHIEAAYTAMYERSMADLPPEHISIEPIESFSKPEANSHYDHATMLPSALALHKQGKLAEAESIYRELLQLHPRHVDALQLLATIAAQRRQYEAAVELFDRALSINPDHISSLNNRGVALHELRQYAEALLAFDRAILLSPDYVDAYYNRGNTLKVLKRYGEALLSFDKAIACKPDKADAHYHRGITLRKLKRYNESLLSTDKAIALKPDYAEAYNSRGATLKELMLYKEALDSYGKSVELNPACAEVYSNMGNVLMALRRNEEAQRNFERAIALKPDYAGGYWNLSLCCLLTGNFEKGWELYEWRWKNDALAFPKRKFEQPLWLGSEKIEGKRVLLYSEQGLGDTIQFCRYARMVAEKGAKVILEVQKPLVKLLASLDGVAQLVGYGEALPDFDVQAPLLSLPLAFKTTLETIPCSAAYLKSNAEKVNAWALRLGEKRMPRIGLVWSGSTWHNNDPVRSVLLLELLKHLPVGFEYISLQKKVRDVDRPVLQSHPEMRHFGDELHDFSDTAALCELMDIVISVDTSVAHASGALGKPTWVLLPFSPDWRWLLDRPDSPWYPAMRLFRQQSLDGWSGVFEEVCEALMDLLHQTSQEFATGQQISSALLEGVAPEPASLPVPYASMLPSAHSLYQQGRLTEAAALCREMLLSQPEDVKVLTLLAIICARERKFVDAIALFDRAITLKSADPVLFYNLGCALQQMKRYEEAISSYEKAIQYKPDYVAACNNMGNVFFKLTRYEEALQCYERAIVLSPDYVQAHSNRGNVLHLLKRYEESLSSYDRALLLSPDYVDAHYNRGIALHHLKQYEKELECYEKVLLLKPDYANISGIWLHSRMRICEWSDVDRHCAQLASNIKRGNQASAPFTVLVLFDSPSIQQQAARIFTQTRFPANPVLSGITKRVPRDKIRIGYYSGDFHNHATSYLMAGLFKEHDRSRFELFAFSFGPDKDDEMRRRVVAVFDHFIDVRNQSDEEVARLSRSLEIDIAIDLKGFTRDSRTGIFALRAAPIQVNYLGYPGTMGAEYIDYLIADATLIPEQSRKYYTEKIVSLPYSYQVNDVTRGIAKRVFTRKELGLPEKGFVFCCFNNNYKISPTIFDCWMRLLKRLEGSLLWLLADNPKAADNLRKEAMLRGVDAERLIFARRMPLAEHLARHRSADLFLDTLSYNAHTTASDALWGGLPVLTCMGGSFASRVAASLLNAIKLPELITTSLAEYEALAIELALNPEKLGHIRRKLERNRLTTPLFDTRRFTRHIEAAYSAMYERSMADLPPAHFSIEPIERFSKPGFANKRSDHAATLQSALVLHNQGRLTEADAIYRELLQLQPNHSEALRLLATLTAQRGLFTEAVVLFDQALAISPDNSMLLYNRGLALQELKRYDDALASYAKTVAVNPHYADAHNNRGVIFKELKRYEEALSSYDRAIAVKSGYADAYYNRGNVLLELKRFREALLSYEKAIALKPDYARAHWSRGNIFEGMRRYEEALSSYEKAIAANPGNVAWFGIWLHIRMMICEWSDFEKHLVTLAAIIESGTSALAPYPVLALFDSPLLQQRVAKLYAETRFPSNQTLPVMPWPGRHNKIRIGYYSADFRCHPVSYLMVGLFEMHDRSRFEVIAFSFGSAEDDEMRQRVAAAFDQFIDVSNHSDSDVALLSRTLEIDIAVDLGGFTAGSRTGVFALRAAPIQVNYMGYPGTTGAEYIDYLIADRIVIPEKSRQYFTEKIVYLPGSFQANDSKRLIADRVFSRKELGLPEKGFVFCCFNNSYKITPSAFASWMRILQHVEGSVLWLVERHPKETVNLRREAAGAGVETERLIFAQRLPLYADYLARYRTADLFLDTVVFNAHTTASDALWAGLPVLTSPGESYISRVAASLLHALQLSELIATSPAEYEALAIELALNPGKLMHLRKKLAANRLTASLFDTRRFTRHIEAAYTAMYERYQTDVSPDHFSVESFDGQ